MPDSRERSREDESVPPSRQEEHQYRNGLSSSRLNINYTTTPRPDYVVDAQIESVKKSKSEMLEKVSFIVFILAWVIITVLFFARITT